MSDPPLSDIGFKNKMAWVWTALKDRPLSQLSLILFIFQTVNPTQIDQRVTQTLSKIYPHQNFIEFRDLLLLYFFCLFVIKWISLSGFPRRSHLGQKVIFHFWFHQRKSLPEVISISMSLEVELKKWRSCLATSYCYLQWYELGPWGSQRSISNFFPENKRGVKLNYSWKKVNL